MKGKMTRLAAHYIFAGRSFHLSYAAFDADSCCQEIAPLTEEIASTAFMNGILLLIPQGLMGKWSAIQQRLMAASTLSYPDLLQLLQEEMPYKFRTGGGYVVYQLTLPPFSSTKILL